MGGHLDSGTCRRHFWTLLNSFGESKSGQVLKGPLRCLVIFWRTCLIVFVTNMGGICILDVLDTFGNTFRNSLQKEAKYRRQRHVRNLWGCQKVLFWGQIWDEFRRHLGHVSETLPKCSLGPPPWPLGPKMQQFWLQCLCVCVSVCGDGGHEGHEGHEGDEEA